MKSSLFLVDECSDFSVPFPLTYCSLWLSFSFCLYYNGSENISFHFRDRYHLHSSLFLSLHVGVLQCDLFGPCASFPPLCWGTHLPSGCDLAAPPPNCHLKGMDFLRVFILLRFSCDSLHHPQVKGARGRDNAYELRVLQSICMEQALTRMSHFAAEHVCWPQIV